VSAYSAGVFHLMTHAFFKALLFLGAGSVIIGMHHEQDIRRMGGLRKYMPITWITALIGSIALIGIPGFSGFYSKDTIIEAVHLSRIPGAGFAYFAVAAGVFITAFYSFRMYFLVFHGAERFPTSTHHAAHVDTTAPDQEHDDEHASDHGAHAGPPHETPWVVTVPLVLLAIPSVVIGAMTIGPMLFGDFFKGSIVVAESHNVLAEVGKEFHGALAMALHGMTQLPFFLALAGVALAWFFYLKRPDLPEAIAQKASGLYKLLDNKYYFDQFNQWFFAGGARKLGQGLSEGGDRTVIDGWMVNGAAKLVGTASAVIRYLQTGFVYHYAFAMLIGVAALLTWWLSRI
jgi:NADH-quinone oxidoreductase subunit L